MTSKSSSWHKKHIMTSKSLSLYQKHVFIIFCKKNMSRRQKAGHGVKNTSCQQNVKTHYDVIKLDITTKNASTRQKVCHVVNKFHDVKTFVITSINVTYSPWAKWEVGTIWGHLRKLVYWRYTYGHYKNAWWTFQTHSLSFYRGFNTNMQKLFFK